MNQNNQFIDNLKQILSTATTEYESLVNSIIDGTQQIILTGKGITPDESKFVADFHFNQFKKFIHQRKSHFKLISRKYALSRNDSNQFICSLTIEVEERLLEN